jgi:gamma-glutamyltranspeptidase/glutathione hydrolase
MFCLYFDAKDRKVRSLNGSGRSPANSSLEWLRKELGIHRGEDGRIPTTSVHSITVPGAAAGWVDCVQKFGSGKLSMEQILAPAIRLAEEGFPVSEASAYFVGLPSHRYLQNN